MLLAHVGPGRNVGVPYMHAGEPTGRRHVRSVRRKAGVLVIDTDMENGKTRSPNSKESLKSQAALLSRYTGFGNVILTMHYGGLPYYHNGLPTQQHTRSGECPFAPQGA